MSADHASPPTNPASRTRSAHSDYDTIEKRFYGQGTGVESQSVYVPTRYNSAAAGPRKPGLDDSLSASIPGGGGEGIATGASGWAAKLRRAPPGQGAALYEAVFPLQSEPPEREREPDGARRAPLPERRHAPEVSLKPEGGMQLESSSRADFPPRQATTPTRVHPADHLQPEGEMAGRSATHSAFQSTTGQRPQLLEDAGLPPSASQLRIIRPDIRRNPDNLSLAGEVESLSAAGGRQRPYSGKGTSGEGTGTSK